MNRVFRLMYKINILGYLINKYLYKVNIGNYVNFMVKGKVLFNKSVSIRCFSEIVVPENSILKLNRNVFIGKFVEIGAIDIFIDNGTSIQNNCILLGNIKIGKNCLFGPNIYVSSGYHQFRYKPELLIRDQDIIWRKENKDVSNFITIEDDVWIGKNVVIINGVTIGKGAIIGANSLIRKDVSPYSVVGGNPQKEISNRLNFVRDIPETLDGKLISSYPYFYTGIDYSLDITKKYGYPLITDNSFALYVKNKNSLPYIIIELVIDIESIISYEEQNVKVSLNNNLAKFNIHKNHNNKYVFLINNTKKIMIKKVYFSV